MRFPTDVEPMLIKHWKNAEDGGAALRQNWDTSSVSRKDVMQRSQAL